MDLLTPLPSEARATVARVAGAPAQDVFIFEEPEENPISRTMLHFHKVTATSLSLDEMIRQHIQRVLEKTDGKVHGPGGAAELLGINANTLRNRMNKLGITYGRKKRST